MAFSCIARSVAPFVSRAAKLKVTQLIVDEQRVVRAKRDDEPANEGFLIYDLEGELFFGVAPELEKTFRDIRYRLEAENVDRLLLRLKRVRNPDVVMLKQLKHFLEDLKAQGVDVWLAGLRPDLIAALHRLNFGEWFPDERLLVHGAEDYSATLSAIRQIRETLPTEPDKPKLHDEQKLYYLV